MESSDGACTICASSWVGNLDFDCWSECILSEIVPLDSSSQPSQFIPSTHLVAHCKSCNSGVQFLPPDKVRKSFCQYNFFTHLRGALGDSFMVKKLCAMKQFLSFLLMLWSVLLLLFLVFDHSCVSWWVSILFLLLCDFHPYYLKQSYTLVLPLSSVCRKPTKKLGAFCWLAVAIAIVETLICVKFGQGTICFQQMSLPNRFGKCGCILNKALSSTMHSHHCEVLFMCSNTLSIWFLHLNQILLWISFWVVYFSRSLPQANASLDFLVLDDSWGWPHLIP
jgi:hypothetical protein